jgi:hypothetical protein
MREWRAIFADSPDGFSELVKRGELKAPLFDGFGYAAAAGVIDGRVLSAMWVIDPETEQGNIIAFSGHVPPPGDLAARITAQTAVFPMKRLDP